MQCHVPSGCDNISLRGVEREPLEGYDGVL